MEGSNWTLPLRHVPVRAKTDLSVVWNNVHLSYEQKLFGQVTSLSYNNAGSLLGCTATNQFTLLRVPQSEDVLVNEQTERKNFSVNFRDDDKLYIQAVNQRVVVKSSETSFERQFQGHTREVRDAIFLGRHSFVSGSDDTTIKLWDLLCENALETGSAHTDYVRCLELYSSGAFFSGSYDHSINLWDPRAGLAAPLQQSKDAMNSAVEALCYVHGDDILVCGAGDQVVLFDLRKGLATPLFKSSFHTKSVSALAYSAEHKTLLTGSLDCRVKMFTLEKGELHCLATKRFDSPIAALAVHPKSTQFAVGMTTGEMKVFQFREQPSAADTADEEAVGGVLEVPKKDTSHNVLERKMHEVQHQLKSFQYGRSMRTALYSRHPDVIMSTLEELLRRGTLHIALSNQNDRTIARILRFAVEYVDRPQFTDAMLAVLEYIFEIYGTTVSSSTFFHREMIIAQKRIGAALALMQQMEKTMSLMELIVNAE